MGATPPLPPRSPFSLLLPPSPSPLFHPFLSSLRLLLFFHPSVYLFISPLFLYTRSSFPQPPPYFSSSLSFLFLHSPLFSTHFPHSLPFLFPIPILNHPVPYPSYLLRPPLFPPSRALSYHLSPYLLPIVKQPPR